MNKRPWDVQFLAQALGAELRGGGVANITHVSTDTRTIAKGALFVALRGTHYDGHAFVQDAVNAGAGAVLVDTSMRGLSVPTLVVKDTLRTLGDLGALARAARADAKVVAVTGSNGKTTTKELIAAVMSMRGPVHKTTGNLNNLIGVPQTLLAWPDACFAAVVELGMNQMGEIARLCEISNPNVGVVTNVAAAHLQGLGSLEAVARAKCELYAGLRADATAVLNADDALLVKEATGVLRGKRVLRFGTSQGCDVQVLSQRTMSTGLHLTLSILGESTEVLLPLFGAHNAMNAAAAAAVAVCFDMSAADISVGLSGVVVPGARFKIFRDVAGMNIVDDTYNANPGSMIAAFKTVADLAGTARRVAVVGDMFELGEHAAELHRQVGRAAADAGMSYVLSLGSHAGDVARGAEQGGAQAMSFEDVDALVAALQKILTKSDWVLVKGSRGMRMERVVQAFVGGH